MPGGAGVVKARAHFSRAAALAGRAVACHIDAMAAQVLFNPLSFAESVATKSDVGEIKHDITMLGRDLTEAEARLERRVAEAEGRMKLEISQAKNETLRWVFGFNLVLIGAIFTIVKFVR